jgi:AcrR family transcriptional regulator
MSPKYVDRKQKIRDIAQAALRLFSQKGFAATSVGRIAKLAGIGKGTIYEYFESKEEIFVAAISEWMTQFEMRLASCLVGIEDPVRRLQAIAQASKELCDPIDPTTARLFLEILQQSLTEGGVIFKRRYLMKELTAGMRRIVVDILLDGISKGVFRPDIARDAEKIAINFLAYLDGIGLHSMLSKNYFDLQVQIDFYLKNLLRAAIIQPKKETS